MSGLAAPGSGAKCQGPIPVDNVIGKAIVIVMPPSRWGTIGNPDIDPATRTTDEHGAEGPASRQRSWAAAESCGWRRNCSARGIGGARLAAMDEVGRGALAGPVTVGVVVVTATIGRVPPGLRDSKLLTPAAREALVRPVRRWVTEYAVGHASPAEIDTIGIIAALRMAGQRALAGAVRPGRCGAAGRQPQLPEHPDAAAAADDDDPPLFEVAPVDRPARPSRRCTSGSRPT